MRAPSSLRRIGAAVRSAPCAGAMRLALLLALSGVLAALGGCVLGGGRCESDVDCNGDLCARNGECASALMFVRATWTVGGAPPTEASCAAHPWLSITFEDRDYEDALTYEPIRCTLGQITFDRMPTRYDEVELRAQDADGDLVTSRRSAIQPPGVMIDWDLGAQAAPTN
ncbi:MAG TPA: hypothetical protein VNM90_11040 [Haliangium sp.]|nr:hypothetical protein [Haliangium sp.]